MDAKKPPRGSRATLVNRFDGMRFHSQPDLVAIEEPLELRLAYGPAGARAVKSISVTMRTPGHDAELAAGFLVTEGLVSDESHIDSIVVGISEDSEPASVIELRDGVDEIAFESSKGSNVITVALAPHVEVSVSNLQRNFYTTSSCGICGKASLLALRTVCPPRRANTFSIDAETLCSMPERLRAAQGIFDQTGGLHAAGLFTVSGELDSLREDVGRHNAVDKLLGAAFLEDRLPLRDRVLVLSGRVSFELMQKALMGGLPMVVAVGAPSSLAVQVAREFDITLVGFLRDNHFNVYHGAGRVLPTKTRAVTAVEFHEKAGR
jgi:FdhD protein